MVIFTPKVAVKFSFSTFHFNFNSHSFSWSYVDVFCDQDWAGHKQMTYWSKCTLWTLGPHKVHTGYTHSVQNRRWLQDLPVPVITKKFSSMQNGCKLNRIWKFQYLSSKLKVQTKFFISKLSPDLLYQLMEVNEYILEQELAIPCQKNHRRKQTSLMAISYETNIR